METTDRETIERRVQAAPDADALKRIVATLGELPGSRGRTYTAEDLLARIDAAVLVPSRVDRITRSLGLRDKVRELARRNDRRAL